jgi:hypothetical protein
MTRPFPGFDRLYDLSAAGGRRPFRGHFDHDAPFELSRGERRLRRPVQITWAMGSSLPGDVVWTTSVHPLIVSSRVQEILNACKATGWRTFQVEVFDKQGKRRPGYVGISVVGRCGRITLGRSQIVLKKYPGGYFPQFHGHFFRPSSWDGSDFCVDRPDAKGNSSTTRIVTESIIDVLKRHRISSIRWTRLTEVTVHTGLFEIGRRYLLPRDFEARVESAYRAAGVRAPKNWRSQGAA